MTSNVKEDNMTNFKRYFRSHLRANLLPFLYILAAILILTFIIGRSTNVGLIHRGNKTYRSTINVPVIFLFFLAYVLPVMQFSFFKRRINLDFVYSLPISRRSLGIAHYLTGLLILFCSFTASYLLNFAFLLYRGSEWFHFGPMVGHYFLMLLLGVSTYSVMVFVFNEANRTGDGIWFMILYTFVFGVLGDFVSEMFVPEKLLYHGTSFYSFGNYIFLTTHFQRLIEVNSRFTTYNFWEHPDDICGLIFWIVLGIGAAIGLFFTFGKRRIEKTEEISDSFFGFRVLIPTFAFIFSSAIKPTTSSLLLAVFLELLTLLGYTIYRRGFRYEKSDLAVLGFLLILAFI